MTIEVVVRNLLDQHLVISPADEEKNKIIDATTEEIVKNLLPSSSVTLRDGREGPLYMAMMRHLGNLADFALPLQCRVSLSLDNVVTFQSDNLTLTVALPK